MIKGRYESTAVFLHVTNMDVSETQAATAFLDRALRYAPNLAHIDISRTDALSTLIKHVPHSKRLQSVTCAACNVIHAEQLRPLADLPSMQRLICPENAICDNDDELKQLHQLFVGDSKDRRVIPFWL